MSLYNYVTVLEYIVEVHTGSEAGADSEVNVHAQIFGTQGDTGVRKLLKSEDHAIDNMFRTGKVTIIVIKCVFELLLKGVTFML